jgi:CRISPR-associated protein Cas1
MKRHLNTLFVTTPGTYLAKEGQAVRVKVEKQTRLRVPLINLESIVCFGRISCSPALMGACAENGISISFLTDRGQFQAAVVGFSPGNVLLRRQQYRDADSSERSCEIARNIVAAKIANCRTVLLRAARDTPRENAADQIKQTATAMLDPLDSARKATDLDKLRGNEGDAAAKYFGVFDSMINDPDSGFKFAGRSRRPPLDEINALLSFLYTMLTHDARSACETTGLDAAVGFLHRDRPGRPGLALDLIEEFRPVLVDRLVLSLINRRQVTMSDFTLTESGAIHLTDAARKVVLEAWQRRKQETITHPFLGEETTIGLLLHLQARLLARHIRGDLDAYPPFIWK